MGGASPAADADGSALGPWAAAVRQLAQQPNVECMQLGGVVSGFRNASTLQQV